MRLKNLAHYELISQESLEKSGNGSLKPAGRKWHLSALRTM